MGLFPECSHHWHFFFFPFKKKTACCPHMTVHFLFIAEERSWNTSCSVFCHFQLVIFSYFFFFFSYFNTFRCTSFTYFLLPLQYSPNKLYPIIYSLSALILDSLVVSKVLLIEIVWQQPSFFISREPFLNGITMYKEFYILIFCKYWKIISENLHQYILPPMRDPIFLQIY